jgi:hypothetical protein
MFLKTKEMSPRDYQKPRTKVRKIIVLTSLASVPPVKASPGHNPLFYLHCNLYLFIYFYALSSQELLGTLVAFFQEPMY